jgi:hypothetical protein
MNKAHFNTKIWTDLRQKWLKLDAEGHTLKVDFNIMKDPEDASQDLAMDVAQNIDGEWLVQTVQRQAGEARRLLGLEGLEPGQLIMLARQLISSLADEGTDELHLFLKRISPETSEIHGHVVSLTGEKIGLRTNYQHYYVLNELLEQTARARQKQYSELRVHRSKADSGKIFFEVVPIQ